MDLSADSGKSPTGRSSRPAILPDEFWATSIPQQMDYGSFLTEELDDPASGKVPRLRPSQRRIRHIRQICFRNLTTNIKREGHSKKRGDYIRGNTVGKPAIHGEIHSSSSLDHLTIQETDDQTFDTHSLSVDLDAQHTESSDRIIEPIVFPKPANNTQEERFGNEIPKGRKGRSRRNTRDTYLGLTSPVVRQQRLQEFNRQHFMDSFYTLHLSKHDSPFYISETVLSSTAPDFGLMDLKGIKESQFAILVIKLWGKYGDDWRILSQISLNLKTLVFAGTTWDELPHLESCNAPIFRLKDGFYFLLPDVPESLKRQRLKTSMSLSNGQVVHETGIAVDSLEDENVSQVPDDDVGNSSKNERLKSCSLDMSMKLLNLRSVAQDALATSKASQVVINELLSNKSHPAVANKEIINISHAIARARTEIYSIQRRTELLKSSILTLSSFKRQIEQLAKNSNIYMRDRREQICLEQEKIEEMSTKLKHTKLAIKRQEGRILSTLRQIARLESEFAGSRTIYSIGGCVFDLKDTGKQNENNIGIVMGHTVLLLFMVSLYLSVPLKYPVEWIGSHSYIVDHVNDLKGNRVFPLWVKDAPPIRFEYGFYLFNRNVQQITNTYKLLQARNIPVVSMNEPLANLKLLFEQLELQSGDARISRDLSVKKSLIHLLQSQPKTGENN